MRSSTQPALARLANFAPHCGGSVTATQWAQDKRYVLLYCFQGFLNLTLILCIIFNLITLISILLEQAWSGFELGTCAPSRACRLRYSCYAARVTGMSAFLFCLFLQLNNSVYPILSRAATMLRVAAVRIRSALRQPADRSAHMQSDTAGGLMRAAFSMIVLSFGAAPCGRGHFRCPVGAQGFLPSRSRLCRTSLSALAAPRRTARTRRAPKRTFHRFSYSIVVVELI
jgi:hypothetical protein